MTAISLQLFKTSALRNLQSYPRCLEFWWPIIDARSGRYQATAEDLLLNPVFRWVFLNRSDKLEAFENQISLLESALGVGQLRTFYDQLLQDVSSHPIENYAHNRLLSAMTEIRAILRLSSEGYIITLVPRCEGQKTPDFKADKGLQSYLVEVKYIRPPDKLEEYLLRWWQAKKEVRKSIPLGLLPHLKFEWSSVESRDELSQDEIASLKTFFTTVLQQPELSRDLTTGNSRGRPLVYWFNKFIQGPNLKIPINQCPSGPV